MKASELRMGNWLMRDSQPEGFLVDAQTILRMSLSGIRDEKPIPLTEEWLVKLGFKKDRIDYWRPDEWFYAINQKSDGTFWLAEDECDPVTEIKYVHQLQNLYFALTGEELTIKE